MSEQLDVQALARPAPSGTAGSGGIPTDDPAAPTTHSPATVPRPAVPHPGLSGALRARIARDFLPRWTTEWGGRFFAEGQVPGPQAIRLDGNDYLFNLDQDARERANLGKKHPQRLNDMRSAWEAWNASMPPIPDDALVSLGYSVKDMPQR